MSDLNKSSYIKEDWVNKKKLEKNKVYDIINKTTKDIITNVDKFKLYLDIQSKFDKYSVANTLLIFKQMPEAIKLKGFKEWKEKSIRINKSEKGIIILEPGNMYKRSDGSTFTNFNTKRVFDISQTSNLEKENKTQSYDNKIILKALLNDCPANIEVTDMLENNKSAVYDRESNILYICRGLDSSVVFKSIASELSNIEVDDDFKSKCVSYMLCKKYNIPVDDFKFDLLHEYFKDMSESEIRNEFKSAKETLENINSRVIQYLNKVSKDKEYEK